jgi:alkaline phosphatase D
LIIASSALAGSGLAGVLAHAQAPAIVSADKSRPGFPSGVQSGDALADRAIVWSRADRAARMWVEWSTAASFANAQRVRGPHALETSDYTARIDLAGLPAGQDIFYRVIWEDLQGGALSQPMAGHLRTAPAARRNVRFLWSGDTAGQGWGINLEQGGMKIYEAMRQLNPDFFIHNGDTIYADGPIKAEVVIADGPLKGMVWKNLVSEEKSKVAETLKEFRGAYRYNNLDANMVRFNSEVMQIWQWDDHEVLNNWSSSKDLGGNAAYSEKNVALLSARASRAFLENAPIRWHSQEEEQRVYRRIPYGPLLDVFVIDMRSYRGPNTHNTQETLNEESQYLGPAQLAWLKDGLRKSGAVWKVIASDMPLGLLVDDGRDAQGRRMFEAVANGNGPARGRELEIADLLRTIKRDKVRNTVWLTADVHYTAAHYYDPAQARFNDFEPFWEFVSGPLHAGTFGPNETDDSFGIQVKYQKAPEAGRVNLSPAEGMQFFGDVQIDARTAAMTVHLRDVSGASLWNTTLVPKKA